VRRGGDRLTGVKALPILMPICAACRREHSLPSCHGECLCPVDHEPVIKHGIEGKCPRGLYPDDLEAVLAARLRAMEERRRLANDPPQPPRKNFTQGPGTELHKLLRGWPWRIEIEPGCACMRHILEMNEKGPDWCEANLDTVVGWLRIEHARRKMKMPFIEAGARLLVKLAIGKARKKAAK
jgi:hypothetical protein